MYEYVYIINTYIYSCTYRHALELEPCAVYVQQRERESVCVRERETVCVREKETEILIFLYACKKKMYKYQYVIRIYIHIYIYEYTLCLSLFCT